MDTSANQYIITKKVLFLFNTLLRNINWELVKVTALILYGYYCPALPWHGSGSDTVQPGLHCFSVITQVKMT